MEDIVIDRNSFDQIMLANNLVEVGGYKYMLPNCNMLFTFKDSSIDLGLVWVEGIILMELSMSIFDYFKEYSQDGKNKKVANSGNYCLLDPLEVASHPSITNTIVYEAAKRQQKGQWQVRAELMKQLLQSDYEHCYTKHLYIYTTGALAQVIQMAKLYFSQAQPKKEPQI